MKKIFLLITSIFLLTGCSIFKSDALKDVDVYTTTYPVNYIINYLYGENANIYSIYPSGVNFKEYELSDKKINEFAKSSLFVFNSQDIDRNYAVDMLNKNSNLKLIDSTLGMNYTHSIEELWLNPYNYLMMAKNTKTSLNEYIEDPYLNKDINEKYEELQYELSKLDAVYKETLKDAKYTTIVADNELFKFLEKYNIEVIVLEEDIKNITIKTGDNLSDISKEYNVSISDILTYNNKTDETLKVGESINIPIKTIESSNVNLVKKLIAEKQIKYIFSDSLESNSTVTNLIKENSLELITINTMYSIDGNVTNTNENYLTIMNDNLELFKKELYK
ncbi:MAG: zinc ABC transporter substrate-binding protein [Bacilli bacterium]|nr:zinc ABC transporter substrate-binding protein [Bacilli bacterium]